MVVQAMWGMKQYPSAKNEWSIEKQLEEIKRADFDAIDLDVPYVVGKEEYWKNLLSKFDLKMGVQGPFVHSIEDLDHCVQVMLQMQAPYLDAQVGNYFIPEKEALSLLKKLADQATSHEIALLVQTHRGRVTQDLQRTVNFVKAIPNLRLNLDLSHYFVSCEMGLEELSKEALEAFDVLLRRTAMIDGRVSNGHQVQIDIGAQGESVYLKHYLKLWKQAMKYWLADAGPGDVFIFRPELGPPNYSILGLDGREISDRFAQAKIFAEIGRRLWKEAQQELATDV
jgi:hypothetical protein